MVAELSAAGVHPPGSWDLTYFEIHAILDGQQKRRTRDMQLAVFAGWHNVNLSRHKRLPSLPPLLRKFEPVRVMSGKAIHAAVRQMAKALGAAVRTVKRGEL